VKEVKKIKERFGKYISTLKLQTLLALAVFAFRRLELNFPSSSGISTRCVVYIGMSVAFVNIRSEVTTVHHLSLKRVYCDVMFKFSVSLKRVSASTKHLSTSFQRYVSIQHFRTYLMTLLFSSPQNFRILILFLVEA
jgi:hypothetical protein